MSYLLVPLDDAIVFPSVTATLQIDVGDEDQVFLLTRRDGEFERVGVVAEVIEHGHVPARRPDRDRGRAAPRPRRHRAIAVEDGTTTPCASRSRRSTTASPMTSTPTSSPASTARSSRRSSSCAETTGASPPSCARSRSRAPWPTPPVSVPTSASTRRSACSTRSTSTARLELAVELQRERLAELQVRSRIREDVESGAQTQQREYFLRKQMDSIRKELGDDEAGLIEEYEKKIAEAEMPEAVEEQAEKELRRLERQGEQSGESSMIRSYLDWLIACRGRSAPKAARSGAHARGPRRRPRRPRRRQETHHRVRRGPQAARRARGREGQPRQRHDPDPGRPSREPARPRSASRSPQPRPRVRPHLPGRAPRRGRDPRPPPHLHRRHAGTDRPCPAGRQDDEPGDPARRGRQGRQPTGAATRPRPCSRCSTRPRTTRSGTTTSTSRSTSPRSSSSPPPTSSTRSRRRCSTAWRSSPSTVTRPPRSWRSPAVPPAAADQAQRPREPTRSRSATRCFNALISEYTREAGVRQLEREIGKLLRGAATRIASGDVRGAPGPDRRRVAAEGPRTAEDLPGVGRAHGDPGCLDRPGRHRHRRRRPLHRGDRHGRREGPGPRPASSAT